jgi:hypothetical protein
MNKGRFLHEEKIKDHSNIGVYGIFSTTKVEWKYYVISYSINSNNKIILSSELCGYPQEATFDNVVKQGKEFKTLEQAKEFINVYKIKWETGSNNTAQEVRDKKINDILETGE